MVEDFHLRGQEVRTDFLTLLGFIFGGKMLPERTRDWVLPYERTVDVT